MGIRGALFSELCGGNMFRLCSMCSVCFVSASARFTGFRGLRFAVRQNATAMLMASSDGNYPLVN